MNMKTKQKGFTLIELVVVIVLLGIIGAVATARFQNMNAVARTSVVRGIAAELSSAAVINFASAQAGGASIGLTAGAAAPGDCTQAVMGSILQAGWPDVSYTVAAGPAAACGTAGNTFTCIIDHADAPPATATLICTG